MPKIKLPPPPQCNTAIMSIDIRTLPGFTPPTFNIRKTSRIYLSDSVAFGAHVAIIAGMSARLEISNCTLKNCVIYVHHRCVLVLKNCILINSTIICDIRAQICVLSDLALENETYQVTPK